ncbi:hypothetical protein PMI03_00187 [Rhizobium sp. AP16]|nr:hypothetical protein PMI03_00187 [Rhizobium sp. AP16]
MMANVVPAKDNVTFRNIKDQFMYFATELDKPVTSIAFVA